MNHKFPKSLPARLSRSVWTAWSSRTSPTKSGADPGSSFIFKTFLAWRLLLFVFLWLAIQFLPLQDNFLGGGKKFYLTNPYLWSWVNFDGEHFLSIARKGYEPLTYFFFPAFPFLVKYLAWHVDPNSFNLTIIGLILVNILTIIALFGLYKLALLDHKTRIAKKIILATILFPASFFLVSYYSESLFLALAVWSFYFARVGKWPAAVILASFATATRVVGIVLLPALAIEMWLQHKVSPKKFSEKTYMLLAIIPLGLLAYLHYLQKTTGDPLVFVNNVGIYGDQRSSNLVLLPQVFYRYIFKILPNLNSYWPMVFTTLLEFSVAILLLAISVLGLFKLRLSYWVFLVLSFIIPTLAGSFSSLPRYTSVIFPMFILTGQWLDNESTMIRITIYTSLILILGFAAALFTRGYWVS